MNKYLIIVITNQPDVSIEIYNTPNLSCVYEEITSIQVPYYIYNLPLCEGTGCSNPDFLEYLFVNPLIHGY